MVSELEKYEFKKKVEELKSVCGRGTELITLYIPPQRQISDAANYLRNEYAQSSNIKSATTRKNVMSAIDAILGRLKFLKKTPENGIAFFIGHKLVTSDLTEMVHYVITPIEPLTTFMYRCDDRFYLEPLEEMLVEKDCYGLIVIDRGEATVGLMKGKRILPIINIQSLVPRKHRMGGQSQKRFERLIEQSAHEFFKKVGDKVNNEFLGKEEIKGILVGGPGATKNFFMENDYINHELRKKIVAIVDVGYTNEHGLTELMAKAEETLATLEIIKEKKILDSFLKEIVKVDSGLSCYGEKEIISALEQGACDVLIISEEVRKTSVKFRCDLCGFTVELINITSSECEKCKAKMNKIEEKDLVSELYKLAEEKGTKIVFVSTSSPEGSAFLKTFGGIGAILRYRIGS
ncbi:MAG: peptide chain release factor aRF-1 [Candidatus Thermoplasmatota archaeon]